jgi:hypothetical protein
MRVDHTDFFKWLLKLFNSQFNRPDTSLTLISTRNPVYTSRSDPSVLVFSLTLYRHPSICILFNSRFTSYNKQQERSHELVDAPEGQGHDRQ